MHDNHPAKNALRRFAAAFDDVAEAIATTEDPVEAFEAASELASEVLPEMAKKAGDVRALGATRIWEGDDQMSYGKLAMTGGIAKSRAAALVAKGQELRRAAAQPKEEEPA